MIRSPFHAALFAALPLVAIACSAAAPDTIGVTESAVQESNGREMNGREMNGREMNGREMNGKSAGVWYARRAGATIMDPLVLSPRTKTLGVVAGPILTGPLGGTISSPLSTITLSHGQLTGVRPNGGKISGTAFKDIYLVGRGPTPPPVSVVVGGGVLTGGTAAQVNAVSTTGAVAVGTAAPVVVATTTASVAQTTADKIRAYVAARLAATNLPERDVPLHVSAAFATSAVNAFHNYSAMPRWHYRVEVKDDDGVYRSFCGTNQDGSERLAIAIPDRFNYAQGLNRTVVSRDHRAGADPTPVTTIQRGGALITDASSFTFACDNAAVAKCVEHLHYDPEMTIGQVSPSSPYFAQAAPAGALLESCVRMFRADFCGNGLSMTLDGTAIDVADSSQVNLASQLSSTEDGGWSLEASWRPDGASCAKKERQVCVSTDNNGGLARMLVSDYIDTICPGAVFSASESDDFLCGASHYLPGVPGGLNGGGVTGGGFTTGGPVHLSYGADLKPAAINTGGGGGTSFTETDVIWTTTKSQNACAVAIPIGQLPATTVSQMAR